MIGLKRSGSGEIVSSDDGSEVFQSVCPEEYLMLIAILVWSLMRQLESCHRD